MATGLELPTFIKAIFKASARPSSNSLMLELPLDSRRTLLLQSFKLALLYF
jgi:hypothetical protein